MGQFEGGDMSKIPRVILFVVIFALMAMFLVSQNTNASIIGKVSDEETGDGIKDVVITATEMKTNGQMIRTSNKKGKFRFVTVPPGGYRITFEHEGYETKTMICAISAEQTVSLKPELKKKTAEEEIKQSGL